MAQFVFNGKKYKHIRLSDSQRSDKEEEDSILWKYTCMGYSVYRTDMDSDYLIVNENNPGQMSLVEVECGKVRLSPLHLATQQLCKNEYVVEHAPRSWL
jgi:hypothetical protein